MKICVDIGHNTKVDTGAVGIKKEDPLNLAVGNLLIKKLVYTGAIVINALEYCKNATTYSTGLAMRAEASNKNNCDLYISIHQNKFDGKTQGAECWYYSDGGKYYSLKILQEIEKLGYVNRGPKLCGVDGKNLYVLKNTKCVAVLVECSFVDSVHDMNLFDANKTATAIAKGITGRTDLLNIGVVNDNPITLKYVVEIQNLLNNIGIKDQAGHILVLDGIVGPNTLYAMKALYDLMLKI
jgi:N-acetylmuramoyl-L-alanine amidase